MALLVDKLSIKWKLSLALILSGLTLVTVYVFIAKRVFENDKISYVFDSQGARLASTKSEIESKFGRVLLSARSVIATYNFQSGKSSPMGAQIFNEERPLIALELWNEQSNTALLRVEKQPAILPPAASDSTVINPGELALSPLDSKHYLLSFRYSSDGQTPVRLRAALELNELMPKMSTSQSLALIQDGAVVLISDLRGIDPTVFAATASEAKAEQDRTFLWTSGENRFLVSQTSLSFGRLKLIAITSEEEALGALGTLFNRSIIFLFLSVFSLIIVSLTLARGLTMNLRIITESAQQIGAGNFEATPKINSKDEIGVLASAFSTMSREIKRLLRETREKARMEEELKTASLIQERLLPTSATASFGEIEVSGMVVTSSECGGDWWYFFTRGDDIYVVIADATGHGTPAALITAAARAIFSRLESETLSLADMLRAWDFAVSSCSQKQVFMTGILMRINSRTGEGRYVNAAHEAPILLRAEADSSYSLDHLDTNPTSRVGDDIPADVEEGRFNLAPNDSLILYTDGLFSVVRPDGKSLSERRFGQKLAKKADLAHSAEDVLKMTLTAFNEHRESYALPDDVSIVAIRRRGPSRRQQLENEIGGLASSGS